MGVESSGFPKQRCGSYVNRVGKEDEMTFSGESVPVDANGNVITKADDSEQIVYVGIDVSQPQKIRTYKPYTQLRRTEFYE